MHNCLEAKLALFISLRENIQFPHPCKNTVIAHSSETCCFHLSEVLECEFIYTACNSSKSYPSDKTSSMSKSLHSGSDADDPLERGWTGLADSSYPQDENPSKSSTRVRRLTRQLLRDVCPARQTSRTCLAGVI
ncbi:hypothetical protein CEXT_125101 [Caerostris extrusa]|uniref:Uncharacterized protein n=1 Tax=Caerostris extrusa TaxID=172846 RepID=A0AAV4S4E7_CAEEX|nr:hypothetical protein CEXT_125101 [Caerostris extrusa]